MKNGPSKEELSRYRQRIAQLTEKLKRTALKAGYADPLFHGVPAVIYRTCGKPTCRCMTKGEKHGPYQAVQVWKDNRSRQITLKKDEEHYFEMAKRHQFQRQNRAQLIEIQEQVLSAVDEMLERRTIWDKK